MAPLASAPAAFTFAPIGVARTPFTDRLSAPRQPPAAEGVRGSIELYAAPGIEDALSDLEGWDYIWVVFVFHLNEERGFRPKVLPPRSPDKRRGLFATRSPYRPNPIGLSAVRLLGVEGLTLRVGGVDMIDGTPVLDIKPYVPYADAHPEARTGWLEGAAVEGKTPSDPNQGFGVQWSARAREEATWLEGALGTPLTAPVEEVLKLGPQPHAYRRIKIDERGHVLAYKALRVRFSVEGKTITVERIESGYRPRQLALAGAEGGEIAVHKAFVERFS